MSEQPRGDVFFVDVFVADDALGNPAAAVVSAARLPVLTMAKLAAAFGLSETAFVVPEPPGFSLRWFTPTHEVPLCGHATIAAIKALETGALVASPASIRFETASGTLHASLRDGSAAVRLPRWETTAFTPPPALGAISARRCTEATVLEYSTPEAIVGLELEPQSILDLETDLVIAMAAGGVDADVTLRVFAPRIGIGEDPVTGSAQCAVAPLIGARLGRAAIRAHQVSARGGRLTAIVEDAGVVISGATRLVRREVLVDDGGGG